jgi:hypothetical protein
LSREVHDISDEMRLMKDVPMQVTELTMQMKQVFLPCAPRAEPFRSSRSLRTFRRDWHGPPTRQLFK